MERTLLGLAWLGLAWLGLAWLGLAWLGLAWLKRIINSTIEKVNSEIEYSLNSLDEIASIEKNELYLNPKFANWNYLDFVYFTVVSLPVNTYGDVIPNSRTVRMLVSLESILSWVILILFINAKFNERKTEQNKG